MSSTSLKSLGSIRLQQAVSAVKKKNKGTYKTESPTPPPLPYRTPLPEQLILPKLPALPAAQPEAAALPEAQPVGPALHDLILPSAKPVRFGKSPKPAWYKRIIKRVRGRMPADKIEQIRGIKHELESTSAADICLLAKYYELDGEDIPHDDLLWLLAIEIADASQD